MKFTFSLITILLFYINGYVQKPIATGSYKFLGNVYSSSQIKDFNKYWNQVTPENAGKWGSVESTRNVMNWAQLDAAYKLAKDNGFYYKHHVLLWGNQQPSWIENLSNEEQLKEIKEWFAAVASRYPDLDAIEVVNEPVNDPPIGATNGNYAKALGGTGVTGYDWILEAFRLARQYFPKAKLMINEYGIENTPNTLNKYMEIINLLKKENLVDQVGFQAHAFSTRGSAAGLKNFLDVLATTGLPLYATELDIDGPSDKVQLDDYMKIFPVIWNHPSVLGVTLWGWRTGLWRNQEKAYLILDNGLERPALEWLKSYVSSTITNVEVQSKTNHTILYPMPILTNYIQIQSEIIYEHAKLYSSSGVLIADKKVENQTVEIPLQLPTGIYNLLLQSKNNTQNFTQQIQINN
jgi:endo-1,4-beta-xylanase